MDLTLLLVFSAIATIILVSSGVSVISTAQLRFIEGFGMRNKYFKWISRRLLSTISLTLKIRTAWIRMITPRGDTDQH